MIKFYTNRELADKLTINFAKWKRWSREFLPPDPLGGMQSGFTRQYSIDDAFKVYLGGHLVSVIKFTIPESKKILDDLHDWMVSVGIYQNFGRDLKHDTGPATFVKHFIIFIQPQPDESDRPVEFLYSIRGIIADSTAKHEGILVRQEQYTETLIPSQNNKPEVLESAEARILNITAVLKKFVNSLSIPETHYDVLGAG